MAAIAAAVSASDTPVFWFPSAEMNLEPTDGTACVVGVEESVLLDVSAGGFVGAECCNCRG